MPLVLDTNILSTVVGSLLGQSRSSRPEVFCEKGVCIYITKACKCFKETPAQVYSCKYCEVFKNICEWLLVLVVSVQVCWESDAIMSDRKLTSKLKLTFNHSNLNFQVECGTCKGGYQKQELVISEPNQQINV